MASIWAAPPTPTLALPALTPSTRRERNDYWRHWMISASREERWQAGALTEPRTIPSGPTIALEPTPGDVVDYVWCTQLSLFEMEV